jgi:hypothetical protein
MRRLSLLATFLVALLSSRSAAETVTIIENGKTDWIITIPPSQGPTERFAAEELSSYLKLMTGVEVPIIPGATQGSAFAIARGGDRENGITIKLVQSPKTKGHVLQLTGWDGNLMLAAVYQFLDEQGCRFLSPALDHYRGAADFVPHKDSIVFDASQNRLAAPKLKFRKIYVEEGHSHTPENLVQIVEWMPKAGYNTLVVPTNYQGHNRVKWDNFRAKVTPECQKRGITIEVGGHGYQNFLSADMDDGKLFTQHPEWFAVDATGKRQKAENWVFNTSNADAVKYLIHNFVEYIKKHPEIQIYDFWPPDGAKWCECDDCKKLGSPSDRQAILLAQVKDALADVRPDLRLEMIAYSSYVDPPEHAKVDKSVLVDFCPINQQFDQQINDPGATKNKNYTDALTAWRKAFEGDISIYSYYRKYAWDSLPVVIPHYMQKDLQWYAKVPVQGVSTYAEPADWFTYELNHYILPQLAWDPDADVDALIKKFCEARYGSSAAKAASVLTTLEQITRNTSSIPNTALKSEKVIDDDLARATKLEEIRNEAKDATDPSVKSALKKLALMCEYLRRDLEIQKLRVTTKNPDEIRTKAQELLDFTRAHANEGVFLVKDQRLSNSRINKRYAIPSN